MAFSNKLIYKTSFWLSVTGVIGLILDFGFPHDKKLNLAIDIYFLFVLIFGLVSLFFRYFVQKAKPKPWVIGFDILTAFLTLFIILFPLLTDVVQGNFSSLFSEGWLRFAVILAFIREFSEVSITYKRAVFNPAQLFVLSFLCIILLGSFMFMLPNATTRNISYVDALFMSTSAVCITGLSVLDVGRDLTMFGQFILLILVQTGGLGILTFASYFAYFFKGGGSYENQLMLSDLTSSNKLGNVFDTLKTIFVITFGIEAFSAIIIYFTLDKSLFLRPFDHIFFSIFHSVSSFCNAGFSTLSDGLHDRHFRFNYLFQLMVIFTFVMGGLGFPIIKNIVSYLIYKLRSFIKNRTEIFIHRAWVLTINSKITLVTTVTIMAIAFFCFFMTEYTNTLSEHFGFGKVVTALFMATTPRSAGYNVVDMGTLHMSSIMFIMLLMWIGASPASTGGGIKTSTFAIALLNIVSLAKGKNKIEVYRREIAPSSINRAFATIALSLLVLGISILFVSAFDSEQGLLKIGFECFSAFSTAGLSLGITSHLSDASKVALVLTMFTGRVTMLTLLIAFFRKSKYSSLYMYPSEEILIN